METLWWEKNPGAERFIKQIVDIVNAEKSVVVGLPEAVPWRENAIEHCFCYPCYDKGSSHSVVTITELIRQPGEYFLDNYCKIEKRLDYRPHISCARFLAESDMIVLNNKIIVYWAHNKDDCEVWIRFMDEYFQWFKGNRQKPVFIVVAKENVEDCRGIKGVSFVNFEHIVSVFDVYAFAVMASQGVSLNKYILHYMAVLLTEICGLDVELCARCIKYKSDFLRDPKKILEKCGANDEVTKNVRNKIYKAQLKTIFPAVEDARVRYVNQYKDKLINYLKREEADIEIKDVYFSIANGKICVPTEVCDEIYRFYKARNSIAHLDIVPYEEVDFLMRHARFSW